MITVRRRPLEDKTNSKCRKNSVPCKQIAIPTGQNQMKNENIIEKKLLRNRKINNYKDLTLSDSPSYRKTPAYTNKHIPIYLQNGISKVTSKNKDPFEFVDTVPVKSKQDDSDSDSSTYDKSIQEALHEIRNREKKEKDKAIQKKIKTVKKKAKAKCDKENNTFKLSYPSNCTPSPLRTSKTSILCKTNCDSPERNDCAENNTHSFESHQLKSPIVLLSSTPIQNRNNSNQINIISNIQLQPGSRTSSPTLSMDDSFSFGYDFDSRDEEMQPWRGSDLHLRRNPHWLLLKNSSLPNYNQEMILEPKLIEKFTPVKPISKETSLIQTQIIDYTNSVLKETPSVNNVSSLFEDHRFSPLKDSNQTKRRILSPLNTNGPNIKRKLDVNNCFGFGSDEDDKENTPPFKRNSCKLPTRISPRDLKKIRNEIVEDLVKEVTNKACNVSIPIESNESVRLFEDLDPQMPAQRTYTVKKRRRRIFSADVEEDEVKHKKKRKDVRTRAEEEEFNKWAAQFNAMCEEVDRHPLEISRI